MIINNNLTLKILANIYNRSNNIKSISCKNHGLSNLIFYSIMTLNKYNNGITSKIKDNSNNNDSLKNNVRIW